ncbi:MAG: hypothetical protein FWG56_02235 [Desulfovibrionaceae bacterium]|nr:hypothetical protein [Desulfovibrionaceae bacterium]
MKAHVSLACWPGLRHQEAALRLADPPVEPCFGHLSAEHVQLVPQSMGQLDEDLADALRAAYPGTRFRLHANVHVLPRHVLADLAGFRHHAAWFQQAALISRRLDAPAYTAHAGRRSAATLDDVLENARRCAEVFGCPVGVEGHYPTPDDTWLISCWEEYRTLFESGAHYALDLSHLHIVATQSGRREETLVADMLASERCLEIHVSANDGRGDRHEVCREPPWWYALLTQAHPAAVVFSEGNHRRQGTLS